MLLRAGFLMMAVLGTASSYANEQVAALSLPSSPKQTTQVAFVSVMQETRAPIGWTQFCHDQPWDCRSDSGNETVRLTNAKLEELNRINTQVNARIAPITDADHYGVTEKWTYPDDNKGDCEDYALLKRRELIARGWPASSLLLTVVRDQKNEGHAVLTAHTSKGDFVLDNVTDELKPWNETGYRFVKRQSTQNSNSWVALSDLANADMAVAAQK